MAMHKEQWQQQAKKIIAAVLMGVLLLSVFTACGKKEDKAANTNDEERRIQANYLINDLFYRKDTIVPINQGSYIEIEGIIRQIDAEQRNILLVDKDNPQDEFALVCHFKEFNADMMAGDQIDVIGKLETITGKGMILENCRAKVVKSVDVVNKEQAEKKAKAEAAQAEAEAKLRAKIEAELKEKYAKEKDSQGNGTNTGYTFTVPEGYAKDWTQSNNYSTTYRSQNYNASFTVRKQFNANLDQDYQALVNTIPGGQIGYRDKGQNYYIVSYQSGDMVHYVRGISKGDTEVIMSWTYPAEYRNQTYPSLLKTANSLKFNS